MSLKLLSTNPFRILGTCVLSLCVITGLDMRTSLADFTFNWLPNHHRAGDQGSDPGPTQTCNFTGITNFGSCEGRAGQGDREIAFANSDTTPFVQEFVEVGGIRYYHVIVGDGRTDAFAQEAYIRVGGQVMADGNDTSSSGGRAITDATRRNCAFGVAVTDACGNGLDPLRNAAAAFTGNGSANPERVIMRQVIRDGDLVDEFSKLDFLKKPTISQKLTAADIVSEFTIDMSNSNYQTNTTPGTIINTVNLIDPLISGDFNAATPVQNSAAVVTAGRYTWTPGPDANFGNSSGSYTYFDGNFDVNAVNWKDFKN